MIGRDAKGDSAMAFAVKGQPSVIEKRTCRICGRYGHEEAVCYEVIRYPPGWGTIVEAEGIMVAGVAEGAAPLEAEDKPRRLQLLCITRLGRLRSTLAQALERAEETHQAQS